jgi:hypothetical protein
LLSVPPTFAEALPQPAALLHDQLMRFVWLVVLIGCGGASHSADAGTRSDSGSSDGGGSDSGVPLDSAIVFDAGQPAFDAGVNCGGGTWGNCADPGSSCMCCPINNLMQACLCTTACTSGADCTDLARPFCDQPSVGSPGICTPMDMCVWGAVCASPDTPIATPTGDRAIAELREGDLVYSMHEGALRIVPIARIARTPVHAHAVVRVRLASGALLEISAGHPTADGRTFGDLAPDAALDGVRIIEVSTVPYEHELTYDILPQSDSGTYIAGGVLIGSTLTH